MNRCLLTALAILISFSVMGQPGQQPPDETSGKSAPWIFRMDSVGSYVDVTVGYAPKSPYNALKGSISINNLILKRFGFYTSIEKGLNKDVLVFHDYDGHTYFTHILGMTASLNKNIYFFGGLDLFTKSGVIYTKDKQRGFRKELGIGITPYKWTVVRLGWSGSVGPTFTIGAKIPLRKKGETSPQ